MPETTPAVEWTVSGYAPFAQCRYCKDVNARLVPMIVNNVVHRLACTKCCISVEIYEELRHKSVQQIIAEQYKIGLVGAQGKDKVVPTICVGCESKLSLKKYEHEGKSYEVCFCKVCCRIRYTAPNSGCDVPYTGPNVPGRM